MPLLNGIDAAKEIGHRCPATRSSCSPCTPRSPTSSPACGRGWPATFSRRAPPPTCPGDRGRLEGRDLPQPRRVAGRRAGLPRRSVRPGRPLSAREREVLQLIAEGKNMKEIGSLLGISARTAETHRARIMGKLDIHDVAGPRPVRDPAGPDPRELTPLSLSARQDPVAGPRCPSRRRPARRPIGALPRPRAAPPRRRASRWGRSSRGLPARRRRGSGGTKSCQRDPAGICWRASRQPGMTRPQEMRRLLPLVGAVELPAVDERAAVVADDRVVGRRHPARAGLQDLVLQAALEGHDAVAGRVLREERLALRPVPVPHLAPVRRRWSGRGPLARRPAPPRARPRSGGCSLPRARPGSSARRGRGRARPIAASACGQRRPPGVASPLRRAREQPRPRFRTGEPAGGAWETSMLRRRPSGPP